MTVELIQDKTGVNSKKHSSYEQLAVGRLGPSYFENIICTYIIMVGGDEARLARPMWRELNLSGSLLAFIGWRWGVIVVVIVITVRLALGELYL